MNPKDDGVTHINIYSRGKTNLGRMLSNFAPIGFTHPIHGRFESVEGFWYWLSLGMKPNHDIFRRLVGHEAKRVGKEQIEVFGRVDNPSFNEEILEAIRCKLRQNKDLLKMLTESTLPFEHYYWYGDENSPKVYNMTKYQWIVDEITRIRNLMQKR